ncbi:hypothetical protein [Microbacterium sp. BK668]|uniref:hypothetical protein n=1 Tax=Microbacterium sp. BK668 TaxID=2512118 RepID=UPI00105F48E0|nr:hypothetical protein [Microbacterium sp. BK668]TDN88396.1 hypothetical protein EV279_2838 [Microbacterium sp. BK668]
MTSNRPVQAPGQAAADAEPPASRAAGPRPHGDDLGERHRASARVADVLFGTTQPRTGSGWKRAALIAALIVAGTLISLYRTPMHSWNVLWAEDAAIFLDGALNGGPAAVFEPWAGYWHVVPRLAILVAAAVPFGVIPLAVTITAAFLTSLIACACFVLLETRLRSVPLRFAAWLVVIALPIAGGEVINNLANLHWFLIVAAFCAVLVRSRSVAFAVLQAVVLFCAVGSDPLALVLLPVVLLRWWLLPAWRDRSIIIAFLAAAIVQVAVTYTGTLVTSGRTFSSDFPTPPEFLEFYAYRVVLTSLFGTEGSMWIAARAGATFSGLMLAGALVLLVVGAVRNADRRWAIIGFGLGSVLFAAVVYSLQWYQLAAAGAMTIADGSRYAVVPSALLLIAVLLSVDALVSELRTPWIRIVSGAVVLCLIALPALFGLRWYNGRDGAVVWPDALRTASEECSTATGERHVEVKGAPFGFPGVNVSCDLLAPFGRNGRG